MIKSKIRSFLIPEKRYKKLKVAAQYFFDEYKGKATEYLERAIDEQVERDIKSGKLPGNFKSLLTEVVYEE